MGRTDSPPILVATPDLPQRDLTRGRRHRPSGAAIDETGFNPWNTTDEFRPLGHLNRARKAVYDASLAHRAADALAAGRRCRCEPHLRRRGALGAAPAINRRVPWHRMPLLVSLLNLDALRHDLREHNLIDTEPREAPPDRATRPADMPARGSHPPHL